MGMDQAGLFCIMAWQRRVWKWLCHRVRNNGWLFTLMSWFGQYTDTNKQRGQKKCVRRVLFCRWCVHEEVCVAWRLKENHRHAKKSKQKADRMDLNFATWHCSLWLNSDCGNLLRGSVSMIPEWSGVSKSAFQTSAACTGRCATALKCTLPLINTGMTAALLGVVTEQSHFLTPPSKYTACCFINTVALKQDHVNNHWQDPTHFDQRIAMAFLASGY